MDNAIDLRLDIKEGNSPLIVGYDFVFDEMTVLKMVDDTPYVVNRMNGKEAKHLYEKLCGKDSSFEDDLK